MCVREHMSPCCQPPRGGYGNASLACLVMWLMVAPPLSQAVWWRPGRVRVPCVSLAIQQWDYIIRKSYHTVHKKVLAPRPSLHSVPCYCLTMLIHLSGGNSCMA